MPTLKMKTKSVSSCVREGSGLHICRKPSKISKNSSSLPHAQITHETAELTTLFQNCANGTMDEPIILQATDDDCYYGSNVSHPSQTFDLSDILISSNGFSGVYFDGFSGFDDTVKNNLLPDFDFGELNIMFDMTENSMILPSLEETTNIKHSQHSGSNEKLLENADSSWFHQVSHQIKLCDQEHDENHGNNDLDDTECFNPYLFLRNLPDLSDGGNTFLSTLLPEETTKRKHVTLVLDLDETLVHSTLELCHNADFTFQVSFNTKEHTVYVRQRPFLGTFLERVAEMFEIIIFTASQSIYAEQLLDKLDPDNKYFSRRAYRDSCIFSDGNYTKDLEVLGVDLAKVAIVDNSPQVFRLQVDNGIPIKSWFDDSSDRALVTLLPFLETLVDVDDVRPIIAKKYGVKE